MQKVFWAKLDQSRLTLATFLSLKVLSLNLYVQYKNKVKIVFNLQEYGEFLEERKKIVEEQKKLLQEKREAKMLRTA